MPRRHHHRHHHHSPPPLKQIEIEIALSEPEPPTARLYNLSDLMDDLEYADFSNDKAWKLLKRYQWDGATVTIAETTPHLLAECIHVKAFRAARFLIQDAKVDRLEACQALLTLCTEPYPFPDKKLGLVELLLEHHDHGIMAYKDLQGRTALQLAYDNKARMDLLTTLAAAVTDVNQVIIRHSAAAAATTTTSGSDDGDTLFHHALRDNQDKVVRMLLQHGAHPNLLDSQGRLPLVVAAHLPTDACLQLLLRHGADVNGTHADDRTVLAMVENPAAAMLLLKKGARSDAADAQGVTPLHTALDLWCRWRRGENLAVLLFCSTTKRNNANSTTMTTNHNNAATTASGNKALLDLLLDQASDINLRDKHGRTVLHYACQVKHTPAPDYVQALVEKGAAVNARDRNGWTPLHVAIAMGNYATAARLVDLGAAIHARDTVMGRTPLHVMGLDAQAQDRLPQLELSHAVRVLAFGPEAPPAPYIVPHHHPPEGDDDQEVDTESTHHEDDDHEAPLIQKFLQKGYDFRTLDRLDNLPFCHATDETLHYLMVHAAACQGLFCFTQKHQTTPKTDSY